MVERGRVEPLVSVLIATYNQAAHIVKAVEGALNQQTQYSFEIIVGDDASTDGTLEIVQAYQEKHPRTVRVVTSGKNVGALENYRRIRKAASGKYLAYCDGDDYWHNNRKIENQADYLERHPDCGLVYSSYDIYHPTKNLLIGDYIRHRKWTMPEKPGLADFLEGKIELLLGILTCTVMVRSALIDHIISSDPYLYDGHQFLMGDTQLWAEVSTKGYLHFIPESTATHNITEESLTRSRDKTKLLKFNISRAKLLLYMAQKYTLSKEILRIHEKELNMHELELAFHLKDRNLAEEVRKRKMQWNLKQKMQYLGAKYRSVNRLYSQVKALSGLWQKNGNPWH